MIRRILMAVGLAGLVGVAATGAWALRPETRLETDFTQASLSSKSSAASSTYTATGMGFGYSLVSYGDDVKWTVHCTTRTYTDPETYSPAVSSSTIHVARNGTPVKGEWQSGCKDPRLVVHGLATSATVYVSLDYGVTRQP